MSLTDNLETLYYAHCMGEYGTVHEALIITELAKLPWAQVILNPSDIAHEKGWKKYSMQYFDMYFLPRITGLVFKRTPTKNSGWVVTSGVVYEVQKCFEKGLPVYEFDWGNPERLVRTYPERFSKLTKLDRLSSSNLVSQQIAERLKV